MGPRLRRQCRGLIQVSGELQQRTAEQVLDDVRRIGVTTEQILRIAAETASPTGAAAAQLVRTRLSVDSRSAGGRCD